MWKWKLEAKAAEAVKNSALPDTLILTPEEDLAQLKDLGNYSVNLKIILGLRLKRFRVKGFHFLQGLSEQRSTVVTS